MAEEGEGGGVEAGSARRVGANANGWQLLYAFALPTDYKSLLGALQKAHLARLILILILLLRRRVR